MKREHSAAQVPGHQKHVHDARRSCHGGGDDVADWSEVVQLVRGGRARRLEFTGSRYALTIAVALSACLALMSRLVRATSIKIVDKEAHEFRTLAGSRILIQHEKGSLDREPEGWVCWGAVHAGAPFQLR
eukprot:2661246-Rhodomonas_salina.1